MIHEPEYDRAYLVVRNKVIRLVALAVALLLCAESAGAAITVHLFRFSAGRYVRFAVADTGTDLSGVTDPVEGLPVYVADEDTSYCYDGATWSACNAGGAGGAPTTAEYVVGALSAGLSAERVGTDTAEIDWDFGTAGQAKLNLIDDSIHIARLATSDTPSVGECLTYAASDEVAFAACGGSDGVGYDEILDEGSGLTKRAQLNFIGSGVSCADNGGSTRTDCTFSGGSSGAPYGELDFNNPPASSFLADEFTGGASLTYVWANQGSATATAQNDGLLIDAVVTDTYHLQCIDTGTHAMPVNTDHTVCTKVSGAGYGTSTNSCALMMLSGGTVASPTQTKWIIDGNFSTDGLYLSEDSDYNLNAGASNAASEPVFFGGQFSPHYFKFSYVDSTRVTTASWSFDGKNWFPFSATITPTADPITYCIGARQTQECFFDFIRVRTDANREECGQ